MGYGDDLLITTFASKIKEQYPDRQIVIGNFEEKRAYHSIIYDNNPNIADCRNIDPNKPTHIINYHQYNRPYIDYEKSTNTKYVWRNFKPKPGQIFFTKEEKLNAKSIISQAIDYWKNTNDENYKKIIFLETSSTKKNNKQFGMKHKNKDWGYENWENLINKIKKDYLIIQSLHHETKKNIGIFTPENLDFRLACAVLNEVE